MAMQITDECINCNACIDECPSNAIFAADEPYKLNGEEHAAPSDEFSYIVKELCTHCEGYSDEASCVTNCPTDAVIDDDGHFG
jgi:ferredoxin